MEEYICRLSDVEKKYLADNLNETDQNRSAKIAEIRKWILGNDDLHARTDDFFILRFLRACSFNIEDTKTKLQNYHQLRTNLPDWFGNRNPLLPELQEIFELGACVPLRQLDDQQRMVVIIRTAAHDPRKHTQANVLKAGLMAVDLATREHEPVSIHGVKAIFDLDGFTYNHVLQMTPKVIRNIVHAWQDCYPLRIEGLDFVNAPAMVNTVLRIFKQFMNPKLKSMVGVHGRDTKTFYESFPARIRPAEYGGTDGTVKDLSQYWKKAVEENGKWFEEDEKYKMVSSK